MNAKDTPVHTPISQNEANALSMGSISISDEVVAALAAQAARKIRGILVVGSSFRLSEILGAKEPSYKGVSVKTDLDTGHVEIDVDVHVLYGTNIYEAATQLQRQISNDVEALTGSMIVDKVNVRVKQLVMADDETKDLLPPDRALPEGLLQERRRHENPEPK